VPIVLGQGCIFKFAKFTKLI